MKRFGGLCRLAGVLGAVCLGAPAGASAITLGAVSSTDPGACQTGPNTAFFVQSTTAQTSPSYVVPAGGGLITSWSTSYGPPGAPVELLVTEPANGNTYQVVASDQENIPSPAPDSNVSTFQLAHPILVSAGDLLGLVYTGGSNSRCFFGSPSSGDTMAVGLGGSTGPGDPLISQTTFSSALVNVSASLIQSSDIAISGAAAPRTITRGNDGLLIFHVTAASGGTGTFSDTLPAGLRPALALAGSTGCSIAGQKVTCPSVSVPQTVTIVVRGATAGTYSDTAAVQSTITDPNPGNNHATTSVRVVAPPVPHCQVPNLQGAPLRVARAVLPLVHCRAGLVSVAASKTVPGGDVISTTPGAGATRPAGTKVAIEVSSGKP